MAQILASNQKGILFTDNFHFPNAHFFFNKRSEREIMSIFFRMLLMVGFVCLNFVANAQDKLGTLSGKITDIKTNEKLEFVSVILQNTNLGSLSDSTGNYKIPNIPLGTYNVAVSFVGYETKIVFDVVISTTSTTFLDAQLESSDEVEGVVVMGSTALFNKTLESPVSLKTLSANEIERNPGGNRDITKVIQSYPGVVSAVSFRSDLVIRGGSSSENKFYLDGVEIPTINHFTTQGATGGAFGMINVNMIKEVDFMAGAFPANRGNTLSSLFEFKQKEGNREQIKGTVIIGVSDFALMADGPINKKTTFNSSIRTSTQGFLGKVLGFPIIPTYTDFQFKIKSNLNEKNEITFIGLGAYDKSTINNDFKNGTIFKSSNDEQKAIFEAFKNNIPGNTQYNFTFGANYKHYTKNGFHQIVLSNSHFNNKNEKYRDGIVVESNRLLNYKSTENELKARYERHFSIKSGYDLVLGAGFENADYSNNTKGIRPTATGVINDEYNTNLNFNKYGLFISASKRYFNEKLNLSLGARLDAADYSNKTSNPLAQFSPRFSLAYNFTDNFSFNFNTGRYYQLPPYTTLGYKDNNNTFVNKSNGLKYIAVNHLIGGLEYNFKNNLKITAEGFYKVYQNYPFLIDQQISLANKGSDFGTIGNEPANSSSEGRSYGLELMAQQKLWKGFYGIVAYTLMKSEFKNNAGNFVPTAWDYRHIAVLTIGKRFKNNWEIGTKIRFASGGPYTPYNASLTANKQVWDAIQQGIPDFSKTNGERVGNFFQTDLRIDKKWQMKKYSFNFYLDIQNITNNSLQQPPVVYADKNTDGTIKTDPNNPDNYLLKQGNFKQSFNLFPTVGLIIQR